MSFQTVNRRGIFLLIILASLFFWLPLQTVSANLFDDFNISDSDSLGNGWIEKNTTAYTILNGAVSKQSVSTGYRNNIVYRPSVEDLLDAEASIELNLNSTSPGYPQVFVRVQSATVSQSDYLDGYILYVNNNNNQAILGRQRGTNFVVALANIYLSSALNTIDTFRLSISAIGADPVTLSATVERFNGLDWEILGRADVNDASAEQIVSAGSVGFGGYIENSYSYDNFRRVDLSSGGAVNPVPVITTMNPSSQTVSGSDFLLTVTGRLFLPTSILRWNGFDRPTTFVSSNELQAIISAADISTAGSASVTIFNPEPGGGLSNIQTFSINEIIPNPVPMIFDMSPTNTTVGGSDFLITVNGTDFIPGTIVRWNGTDRDTTYLSESQLQATITSTDISSIGTADITVFSPEPGGGISNSQIFTIDEIQVPNPLPIASTLTPNSINEDSAGFTLIVNGADFVPGAVVRWNGVDRTTAFISANELQVNILDADLLVAGSVDVTVLNPAPGGGISDYLTFTINEIIPNPLPTITNLNPLSVTAGTTNFQLSVNGDGFINTSVVRLNGFDLVTTFISELELQASVPDTELQTESSVPITVSNPSPGGGESNVVQFTIDAPTTTNPGFSISSLQPDFVYAGSSGVILSIMGNNFTTESIVRWNGSDRPTTFVSDSELQAAISITDVINVGIASVTVDSPDNGLTDPLTFIILDPLSNYFSDSFNRADSETIGNNWTEKLDEAYSIQNGQVLGVRTNDIDGRIYVYRDNIVYRPEIEDIQDVELSAEFIRQQTGGSEYPQLHARVQRDTVTIQDTLGSYIMYVEESLQDPPAVAFAINQDNFPEGECVIGTFNMPSQLIAGERYRMRFRVSGTYPVSLSGYIDRFNGQAWELFAQGAMVHDDNTQPSTVKPYCAPGFVPPPIMNAGSIGFSKWYTDTQVYDNFYWVALNNSSGGGGNPVPATDGIAPISVAAGEPDFILTVTGTDFSLNSIIRWNGSDRATTYVSATELQTTIAATDITVAGSVDITVFNPTPGGGESNVQVFTINDAGSLDNPVPATTQITPGSTLAGGSDFVLTVLGNGFTTDSVVRWNGADVNTVYISDTELEATIQATEISIAGTVSVAVFNPTPGGGISNPQIFTILQPGSAFYDDFERPDSSVLGNGWIEKNPAAFFNIAGEVVKQYNYSSYLYNIVYRPATEDLLDTEVSLEFNLLDSLPGYPQIFARVQSDTVALEGMLDGYMLYINNNLSQAIVGRQVGTSFVTTLTNINISPALNTTDTYRLRLSVIGTNPVEVTGYVERLSATGWDIIGQGAFSDTASERILNAGSVGFGGYIEGSYSFDNFTRLELSQ